MIGDPIELLPPHPLELVVNAKAACRGDHRFVQDRPKKMSRADEEYLRGVCMSCPVRAECREVGDYIEGHPSLAAPAGLLWGGEFPIERQRRRRDAKRRVA